MIKSSVWALTWASCVCLTGCLMTREDVKEAEQKRQMQDQVVHLQKNTADTSNRFSEIESDVRQLSGRLEVVERQSALVNSDKEKQKKVDDDKSADQAKRIAVLEEALGKMEEQLGALNQDVQSLKEGKSSSAKVDDKGGKSPKALQEAESLFEQKEWKKAILSYQKFRDAHPKDKKLNAEATYKTGVCFQELKMKSEAKVFFEEAIAKYPGTDGAKRAGIRLKQLNKTP